MRPATALLEKILSYKDRSPLISILDDAGQSARPLIREFAQRAHRSRRKIVYVSFEEVSLPLWVQKNVEIQKVFGLTTLEERQTTSSHGSTVFLRGMGNIIKDVQRAMSPAKPNNAVVIIDCITPVFLELSMDPIHFLGSLLSLQPYSVILSHHNDIPLPAKFPHYPSAQPLLSHISTTVLQISSFGHYRLKTLADSQALPDPIDQDRNIDGVVLTLGSNTPRQLIVSLEYRRKSGRTLVEKYSFNIANGQVAVLGPAVGELDAQDGSGVDFGTTFNLGITQRQKQSKEGLVLPHFMAQRDAQGKEQAKAGQIEYTLEAEDDFDDEEDVDEDLLI